ncbi:MAG TPA: SIMPL domain-containing protein [Gemmatimonadaceae bacterium]|nr:SIMPL domain-containing protein [Gemmatimonadaceae bacterium]
MRLLSLVAVLALAPAVAAQQQPAPHMEMMGRAPEVITSAQGEARVTPDRATIYIGVQTRASTAAQAASENARKQRAVIDTLRALGIGESQISTVNYNVYPEQIFQPEKGDKTPRIVGYNVTNTVRVEVRKLDGLGALLDAALAKGANAINSLDFYSSNEDEARRSALAAAVARARGDAEALAKGAGGTLGELLEVSSAPMSTPPIPFATAKMSMRAEAAPTPINPGEQTVTVSVMARWRFVAGSK